MIKNAGQFVWREKGFTLIESLIVLSTISILLSFTFVNFSPIMERKVMPQFFDQLANDVLFAQQYAISTKQSVTIVFSPEHNMYIVQSPNENKILIQRKYKKDIQINTRINGAILRYNQSGNLTNPGRYGISYKAKENYSIIFQLGYGRFYVEKW